MTLIVGCGYIGNRLAAALLEAGETVTGMVRSGVSVTQLQGAGITPLQVDLDQPVAVDLNLEGESVFYLAPPPGTGLRDTRMEHFLAAIPAKAAFKRIVLISTTGVYGDCQGEWVDEQRPVNPQAEPAK